MVHRNLKTGLFAMSFVAMVAFGATSLRAENVVGHLSKPIAGLHPCTGENVTGVFEGVILLAGHQFPDGSIRAAGHLSIHGDLQGDRGNVFHVSFEGTEQFTVFTPYFDWAFSGVGATSGSEPNLFFDGVIRVFLDGSPAEVVSWSPHC